MVDDEFGSWIEHFYSRLMVYMQDLVGFWHVFANIVVCFARIRSVRVQIFGIERSEIADEE